MFYLERLVYSHSEKPYKKQLIDTSSVEPKEPNLWSLTSIWVQWTIHALKVLRTSCLKLRRWLKRRGRPGSLLFNSCPDPSSQLHLEDHQRTRQRIPLAGLLETPQCFSGSCWWTAALTSRGAASLWLTRPGRVLNISGNDWWEKKLRLIFLFTATCSKSTNYLDTLKVFLIDYQKGRSVVTRVCLLTEGCKIWS